MTIQEIHKALSEGKTVNWSNGLYYLHYVYAEPTNEYAKPTFKDGKAIRITCSSNYFGALATESCLKACFITE